MSKIKYELIFGLHAVRYLLENDMSRVVEGWAQIGRHDAKLELLVQRLEEQGLTVQRVPKDSLTKLTAGGIHQGIVIRSVARPAATQIGLEECLATIKGPPLLLVLDEIQDPHNLGACLRTADATGVQAVVIPKHRACALSATVSKVASGAAETVPLIQVTNLAQTLRWLQTQGLWLVGADQAGPENLFTATLTGPLALVLGAEGAGLRRLTKEVCDKLVRIPMKGRVESLNVSVVAGVCLYEVMRQREI